MQALSKSLDDEPQALSCIACFEDVFHTYTIETLHIV